MTSSRKLVQSAAYKEAMAMADEGSWNISDIFRKLEAAKAEGDVRATYALASWYISGIEGEIEKDLKLAFDMLRELSDSCIPEALFDLAVFYDRGDIVERDEEMAFSFYMEAALLGDPESNRQMAEFYREGRVVPRNKRIQKAWNVRSRQKEVNISPPYRAWLRPPRVE